MLIKILVILMLLLIIGSLFSALYYLVKGNGDSERTVKALTWRVGLSLTLFLLLVLGFYTGIIGHPQP
jgi:hypothetical protein